MWHHDNQRSIKKGKEQSGAITAHNSIKIKTSDTRSQQQIQTTTTTTTPAAAAAANSSQQPTAKKEQLLYSLAKSPRSLAFGCPRLLVGPRRMLHELGTQIQKTRTVNSAFNLGTGMENEMVCKVFRISSPIGIKAFVCIQVARPFGTLSIMEGSNLSIQKGEPFWV